MAVRMERFHERADADTGYRGNGLQRKRTGCTTAQRACRGALGYKAGLQQEASRAVASRYPVDPGFSLAESAAAKCLAAMLP
jgi:hypothetical protein